MAYALNNQFGQVQTPFNRPLSATGFNNQFVGGGYNTFAQGALGRSGFYGSTVGANPLARYGGAYNNLGASYLQPTAGLNSYRCGNANLSASYLQPSVAYGNLAPLANLRRSFVAPQAPLLNYGSVFPAQSCILAQSAVQQAPQTQVEYEQVPYDTQVVEYQPVTKNVRDYYTIEKRTNYVPVTTPEVITVNVPVQQVQNNVRYEAVQSQVIHAPGSWVSKLQQSNQTPNQNQNVQTPQPVNLNNTNQGRYQTTQPVNQPANNNQFPSFGKNPNQNQTTQPAQNISSSRNYHSLSNTNKNNQNNNNQNNNQNNTPAVNQQAPVNHVNPLVNSFGQRPVVLPTNTVGPIGYAQPLLGSRGFRPAQSQFLGSRRF